MFKRKLEFGQLGESKISSWLRERGRWVLPIYEVEETVGKGPRLFSPERRYIAPDLFVFSLDGVVWVEAKHKSVFTWYRKGSKWTTGIDRNHWQAYLELKNDWPWPIWILFLHESETPDPRDTEFCPASCPTGLFGNSIDLMAETISHESDKWGRNGMVYWAHESLQEIATLEEVNHAHLSLHPVSNMARVTNA